MFELANRYVLEALPPILRRVAFNLDFVDEACQLLWSLGRNDQRELNPHPDHPIRILSSMASYEEGKPVVYNNRVLAAAETWLVDPLLPKYKYSPLDVVEPILAKQAEYHRTAGHSVTFGYLKININAPAVIDLRKAAIAFVERCLMHADLSVSARALKVVQGIVSFPASFLGHVVTEQEVESWKPERMEGARLLKDVLSRRNIVALQVLALQEFHWITKYGKPDEVTREITQTLAGIPETLELRIATAFTRGLFNVGRGKHDSERLQQDFLRELIGEITRDYNTDGVVSKVESVILELLKAGIQIVSPQLLIQLSMQDPDRGQLLIEHIISHQDCALLPFTGAILFALRIAKPEIALSVSRELMKQNSEKFDNQLGRAYWNLDLKDALERDFEVLAYLLKRGDDAKYHALQALRRLRDSDKLKRRRGIELLLSAEIGGDPRLAEALLEALDPDYGIPPSELSDADVELILEKLVLTRDITHQSFHFGRFLGYFLSRKPKRVAEFFVERVKFAVTHKTDQTDYTPIPFGLDGLFGPISDSPEHMDILRSLANALKNGDPLQKYWLTKLFGLVAGGFGPSTVLVIRELAEDNTESSFRLIADLLHEAPRMFIFDNKDLCASLLEKAKLLSPESFKRISGALWATTHSGVFHGIPGQPSPEYLAVRDSARQAASEFGNRPVVSGFFKDVAESAEQRIKDDLERDEEVFFE